MADNLPLKFMSDVYVDDYTSLLTVQSKKDLDHITNTAMHGIHSNFPASAIDSDDPTSERKMIKKDGQWRVEKVVLGWGFEGSEKRIVLDVRHIDSLLLLIY